VNAHVITHAGAALEIELRPTKEPLSLDVTALRYLHGLAQLGAQMRCRLLLRDGHLTMQLDRPVMSED